MSILVTGGSGYIGSHTLIELINKGYRDLISVDNYSNSNVSTYERVEKITGVVVKHYPIDLTDQNSCKLLFEQEKLKVLFTLLHLNQSQNL